MSRFLASISLAAKPSVLGELFTVNVMGSSRFINLNQRLINVNQHLSNVDEPKVFT